MGKHRSITGKKTLRFGKSMRLAATKRGRMHHACCLLSIYLVAACGQSAQPAAERIPVCTEGADPSACVSIDLTRVTAPGAASLETMSSRIAAIRQSISDGSFVEGERRELVTLLLRRASFTGRYGDFDEANALTEAAMRENSESADARLARSAYLSSVHRFRESLSVLEREAPANGDGSAMTGDTARSTLRSIPVADLVSRQIVTAVSLGEDLVDLLDAARERTRLAPSYQSFVDLAAVEAALGNFVAADERFRDALDAYQDVSPFPFAFVAFQRGVMWAEMADDAARAVPLYEEALRRVPGYVVASVHLAELEAEQGRQEAAVARLRAVLSSADPEPKGLLAALLGERQGNEGEANQLIGQARADYEALLARYPLAFADHGAEFFADPAGGNDAQRATELAEANLANRQNGRAYVVALEAYASDESLSRRCAIAQEAEPASQTHPVLRALLEEIQPICGAEPQ